MNARVLIAVLLLGALAAGVRSEPSSPADTYVWRLPRGVPHPKVPADNPMSEAKVRLGRRLFYDTRLSGNGTFACASCHQQKRAFTDGRAHALGSTGQPHPRSAMSLANVAFNASYGWADARTRTLEAQMAVPMFNEHPIEMGMKGNEAAIVGRIAADPTDAAMFSQAFPGQPIALDTIVKAIASFERTIVSANSPLDRYLYRDDRNALTPQAQRGMTPANLAFTCGTRCALVSPMRTEEDLNRLAKDIIGAAEGIEKYSPRSLREIRLTVCARSSARAQCDVTGTPTRDFALSGGWNSNASATAAAMAEISGTRKSPRKSTIPP